MDGTKTLGETPQLSRRHILRWGGAAITVAIAGAVLPNFGISSALAADLGAGDVGILNYAYALEQLEAAFYTMVIASPYRGMSRQEHSILLDIRNHEIAHRQFLKKGLGAKAIPNLQVNFSAVNFNSRQSVLTTAKTFEDLGVSAYNGAGRYLKTPAYLLAAGKIVSVEARHAAVIRDLLRPNSNSFAGPDVVGANGLDKARPPGAVLAAAGPFIKSPVTANNLPGV